jgi:hypothetical protein
MRVGSGDPVGQDDIGGEPALIPRLWVCTSHPVAEWLALPTHPLVILALIALEDLCSRKQWWRASTRVRRLWQSLGIVGLGAFFMFAVAGGVLGLLGSDPDPIFRVAMGIWPLLSISAIVFAYRWAKRDMEHGLPSAEDARAQLLSGLRFWRVLSAGAFCVGLLFALSSALPLPWQIPFNISAYFFDVLTPSIASDECLAFRSVVDSGLASDAGVQAKETLIRRGKEAAIGVADYVSDQIEANEASHSPPKITPFLLEIIAESGDHPLLHVCEQYNWMHAREIGECALAHRRVGPDWKCR